MSDQATCPHCGAIYEVTYHKVAFRDQDNFICRSCGQEMDSWSSSRIPHYRLVQDGTTRDA
ncbi:MJ0042-type zinc finger domain-containing protein [Brevundimonas sp.]|uniref:MJ0042-type zinc finger domain-containing protein n=1 Tax=Brevundimonas sp. TaxID=1871086 RepID=UPI0037844BB3